MKIDFVVSWVDSMDKNWQKRMNQQLKYMGKEELMIDESRYHDFGFFKFWFRSIEKYAPWVNHVYVITDKQKPSFFNETSKFTIVDHSDFIPKKYLPTYSSSVIELFLDKIPNISDHFVYFNDDMLLNSFTSPDDFFNKDGLPMDAAISSVLQPVQKFDYLPFNDMLVINRNFKKKKVLSEHKMKFFSLKYGLNNLLKALLTLPFNNWSNFKIQHIPYSLRKKDYEMLRNYSSKEIDTTARMHFRSNRDINIWLLLELRFMKGEFEPRKVKSGVYFDFDNTKKLINAIERDDAKMICINDDSKEKNLVEKSNEADLIKKALERKFTLKSSVE